MSISSKTIELDFVSMELTENCVIATVKEGVLVELDHIAALHEVFAKYYSDKIFGYIDNRENQYAINLNPELYNSRFPKMAGLAVVCYNENSFKTASFEKSFYNWPFEVFRDLGEAKLWIGTLILEEEKKAGL